MKKLFIVFIVGSLFCCKQQDGARIEEYDSTSFETKNGVLFFKGTPFYGVLHSYDSINETRNVISYLNGKKHGEERKLYSNNKPAEHRTYERGIKVGIHKGWWKNGQQKFEYVFNDQGYYHGKLREWYANGQLFKAFQYENGVEVGSQKMWLSNGNIRANFTVVNGERFGLIGLKKCITINDEK